MADILRTKESVLTLTMEDGINKFIGRMTHTHEITVAGTKLLHTGKLEPIDITVASRCNNKKVNILVLNLVLIINNNDNNNLKIGYSSQ